MKAMMKYAFISVVIFVSIFAAACRMDIQHEFWVEKDGSGEVKIDLVVAFPQTEEAPANPESMDSFFMDMTLMLKAEEGFTITNQDREIVESTDEITIKETLEFKHKDWKKINEVVGSGDRNAVVWTKDGKDESFRFYPPSLHLLSYEKQGENLTFFDLEAKLILHLPRKPDNITGEQPGLNQGKNLSWTWSIDEDWYFSFPGYIVIEY